MAESGASFYFFFLCLSLSVAVFRGKRYVAFSKCYFSLFVEAPNGGRFSLDVNVKLSNPTLKVQELKEPFSLGLDFETEDGLCIVSYFVAKLLVGWWE